MATRERVWPAGNSPLSMATHAVPPSPPRPSSRRWRGIVPWRNSPRFTPPTDWRIIRATEPRNTRVPLPFTALAQYIGERFNRYESTPSPKLATAAEIGAYGERVAGAFLRRHGYQVLTRNYKTTRGEIDLVCRHGDVLVFVEVKTRADEAFGRPAEAIGMGKEEALRHAARRYLEL